MGAVDELHVLLVPGQLAHSMDSLVTNGEGGSEVELPRVFHIRIPLAGFREGQAIQDLKKTDELGG